MRFGERLLEKGLIEQNDLRRALAMQQEQGGLIGELLMRFGFVREADLLGELAEHLDVPLLKRDEWPEEPIAADQLNVDFLINARVVPVAIDEQSIRLAMAEPQDEFTRKGVAMLLGRRVEPVLAGANEIEGLIERLYTVERDEPDTSESGWAGDDDENIEHLRDMASEAPVIRAVNQIINKAVEQGASDIHIEPFEDELIVRYRIDGMLHEQDAPPRRMTAAIISRIKIMGRLNIAERRLPQDGRIQLRAHGKEIDLRVSTVPTLYGESVVMRILDRESIQFDLETMGFSDEVLRQFRETLALPHGILLVTGPTGSGKTTTLYAALNELNAPHRKIITVEDPVEYQLSGINQIQVSVKAGLGFASALRAIVRQDPDVIMLGEMRDLETARTAIQSALTGHTVLSTLHTNDAPSAVTRLIDMGVEDYLISSTVNGVLAQRLVRKLCPHCRETYQPSAGLIDELRLRELIDGEPLLWQARGCSECNHTGYRGRTVIHEFLRIDDAIRDRIMAHADAGQLAQLARARGMRAMAEDGLGKALRGITSLEEVMRVTREAEDAVV